MTDKKLTDEEIIKGLNELSRYTGFQEKHIQVLNATLDLIDRQKSEIEELKNYVNHYKSGKEYWVKCLFEKPNEAIKEFVERLKTSNEFYDSIRVIGNIDKMDSVVNCIDNLLKEMVGEEE